MEAIIASGDRVYRYASTIRRSKKCKESKRPTGELLFYVCVPKKKEKSRKKPSWEHCWRELRAIICPESPPCAGISSGNETKVPRPSAKQRLDPATSGISGLTVKRWFYFILTQILNKGTNKWKIPPPKKHPKWSLRRKHQWVPVK